MYRGADVFKSTIILDKVDDIFSWKLVEGMSEQRCGHSVVTLFNNQVLACGGYGGGVEYKKTVECYVPEQNRWLNMPSMNVSRSGFGAVLSENGSIY